MDPAATQPFLASDVMAFVLAIVAVLYLALWLRDREPGMGWCALSNACLAVWAALNRVHLPTTPYLITSPWFYLACVAMAAQALGLVDYFGITGRERRVALWSTLLPSGLYMALLLVVVFTEVQILRVWANLLLALGFVAMGRLAWRAARIEPGSGFTCVALALWSVPLMSVALVALKLNPVALRYWAVLPVIVLGLTLLTVTVLRRQRSLEAEVARRAAAEAALSTLNGTLEQRVEARTRELQALVTGLESFNRSISHDLRGPLGGISGLATLASDALARGDAAPAQRALPLIAQQAESSTQLVAALLSLARVGDAQLRRRPVDLQVLVDEVIQQLAAQRGDATLPVAAHDLPTVDADPDLLRPVFVNLLGNALKFSGQAAQARVEVCAAQGAEGLTVQVRDNGVGFDSAQAAHLFDPFVRLHSVGFDGHGVGLSIVRRAVERHGGRVWAQSQPGQGAVFSFTLPKAA